ncbi:MAG: hypothetical protein ACM338_00645 [Betaproteobacteria bacterium]
MALDELDVRLREIGCRWAQEQVKQAPDDADHENSGSVERRSAGELERRRSVHSGSIVAPAKMRELTSVKPVGSHFGHAG